MPIDPQHGRFTPDGPRIERLVAQALRAIRKQVIDVVRFGGVTPTSSPTYADLLRTLVPEYARHYVDGAQTAMREARERKPSRRNPDGPIPVTGVGHVLPPFTPPAVRVPEPPGPEPVVSPAVAPPRPPDPPRVSTSSPSAEPPPSLNVDLSRAYDLFLPTVRPAAERMATGFIHEMASTTQDAVRTAVTEGLTAGEPLTRIQARLMGVTEPTMTVTGRVEELPVFSRGRAATIARTEASRAMHAGQYEYGKLMGATGVEWLASADACKLCLSLNGQKRKYGEPFYVWPKAPPEYRNVYFPPAHPNCVCAASDWFEGTSDEELGIIDE